MTMQLELNMARNMFAKPLSPDCRERLEALLQEQTVETWEEAFSIILNREGMTLWRAIIEVDDTFPKTGRRTNPKGKVVKEWERIPDLKLIQRALRFATH